MASRSSLPTGSVCSSAFYCTTISAVVDRLGATSFVIRAHCRQPAATQVQLHGVFRTRPQDVVPLCLTEAPPDARFDSPCAAEFPTARPTSVSVGGPSEPANRSRLISGPLKVAWRAFGVSRSDRSYLLLHGLADSKYLRPEAGQLVTARFFTGTSVTSSCRLCRRTARRRGNNARLTRARKE